MKKALITGITGQDGSYLAELLLAQGYKVIGWAPAELPLDEQHIVHLRDQLTLVRGSLQDQSELLSLLEETQPDEIYNLAAPSSPAQSWKDPVLVGDAAGLGVMRLLVAVRQVCPGSRFFQASSSEIFGLPAESPQNERTPFRPRNPYGISKLYAHLSCESFRRRYGLFAVSGILFNHESPRRGDNFVTRKIASGAARIKLGLDRELRLGNLEARRDWGFAGDYVRAMWLMLNASDPEDFVIGSGHSHSVREFCELAFSYLDLDYQQYVVVDPTFYHPTEEISILADPSKAEQVLGWTFQVSFPELVRMMVQAEVDALHDRSRSL